MFLNSRALSIGALLVILWILVGYIRLGYFQFEPTETERLKDTSKYNIDLSKEDFVAAAINSAVGDDFDYSHVSAMCDDQQWDSTVVFTCHGVIGGIGTTNPSLICMLQDSQ